MCKASFRNLMFLLLLSSTEIVFLTNTTDCSLGYFGSKCELPCRFPSFGEYCQLACFCAKQHCDHIHGCKECPPGFKGKTCQQNCSYPYFGLNCKSKCKCREEQCKSVIGCEGEGYGMGYNEGWEENCTSAGSYRNPNTLLSSIIALSFIALIQFIFYLYFSIFYKPRLLYITRF